jgi:hypothetical protein
MHLPAKPRPSHFRRVIADHDDIMEITEALRGATAFAMSTGMEVVDVIMKIVPDRTERER